MSAAVWWASLKKTGDSFLQVRLDSIGALGGLCLAVGLALHAWSNVTLARAETLAADAPDLVTGGPFRFVRNPIYVAGLPILLGIDLLYSQWRAADAVAFVVLVASFHLLVTRIEEPRLRRRLGDRYEEYCRQVPRWIPRRR